MWQRLLRQKQHEEFYQSFWLWLIIAIVIITATSVSDLDTFSLLKTIIDTIFSAFPSLTGLSLAGYTIIVGGIQPKLLYKMCKHKGDNRNSLMEDLNVTFAVALFMAIMTMGLSFIIRIIYSLPTFWLNNSAVTCINTAASLLLIYFSLVSFRALLAIIINVFNFGQVLDNEFSKIPEEIKSAPTTPQKSDCRLSDLVSRVFGRIFK